MQLLKGSIALVTGGTAGIGKAIALCFAKQGASVAIFGTSEQRAELVVKELKECSADDSQKFLFKLVDVANKGAVDAALTEVVTVLGTINILVNNAGITRDALLMKMSEKDWDDVIATNLKSIYNTSQFVVRPMIKQRKGKIINITSVVGVMGSAGQTNYAASKAGIIGMTKSLAKELASRNICVNCIAPGFIQTPMTDVLTEGQKEAILQKIPMGRFGHAAEIAEAALFLAGSSSDYVTGQVLVVDGGMVC